MDCDAGSSVACRRRRLCSTFHHVFSLSPYFNWFVYEFLVLLGFLTSFAVATCERWCPCSLSILRLLCSPYPSLMLSLVPDLTSLPCISPIDDSCQISDPKTLRHAISFSSSKTKTVLPSGKIDSAWFWSEYGSCTSFFCHCLSDLYVSKALNTATELLRR